MYTLLSVAALAAVHAAEPPPRLGTVVVVAVASRVPQSLDETPATASVVEREALDRLLARDVAQALRYEPGVSVEHNAARFGLGNIAIRGLDGNRVQMLADGVRLPDAYRVGSFSNASRNAFGLGLVSRIEVLRGPGSALYGSDALAGVVAIETLEPRELLEGRSHGGFVEAGHASADRSLHGTAAAAARAGPVELLLGAARSKGEERENRGEVDGTGSARTRANPQDATADSFLAKAVWGLQEGTRLRATLDRFERRVVTDVLSLNPQSARTVSLAGDDAAERTRFSIDLAAEALGPIDRFSLLAYGQHSRTSQATAEVRANTTAQCLSAPGAVTCRREALFELAQREAGATLIAQGERGAHRFVYGAEWSRLRAEESRDGRQVDLATGATSNVVGTDVFPTRDFPISRFERAGLFAQDEIALGRATLVPALRYDRFRLRPEVDSVYATGNPGRVPVALDDAAWSPKLGALVPLGGGVTLALQAATGFRAPPYFDVNVGLSNLPLGYAVIPNPGLEPEKSRGIEAGFRGRHARLDWSLTAYRTSYDNLIVSRAALPCPGHPLCVPTAPITFQSQNVTRARIEGIEARAEARLAREWTARLGAAASRGDDRTRDRPLNSVDPAKVVAGLEWRAHERGAQLHVTGVARKKRIDAAAGTLFATPGFATVDLTAFCRPLANLTLDAGVFNVTDRKHWLWSDVRGVPNAGTTIDRYTQPGRTWSVALKYRF